MPPRRAARSPARQPRPLTTGDRRLVGWPGARRVVKAAQTLRSPLDYFTAPTPLQIEEFNEVTALQIAQNTGPALKLMDYLKDYYTEDSVLRFLGELFAGMKTGQKVCTQACLDFLNCTIQKMGKVRGFNYEQLVDECHEQFLECMKSEDGGGTFVTAFFSLRALESRGEISAQGEARRNAVGTLLRKQYHGHFGKLLALLFIFIALYIRGMIPLLPMLVDTDQVADLLDPNTIKTDIVGAALSGSRISGDTSVTCFMNKTKDGKNVELHVLESWNPDAADLLSERRTLATHQTVQIDDRFVYDFQRGIRNNLYFLTEFTPKTLTAYAAQLMPPSKGEREWLTNWGRNKFQSKGKDEYNLFHAISDKFDNLPDEQAAEEKRYQYAIGVIGRKIIEENKSIVGVPPTFMEDELYRQFEVHIEENLKKAASVITGDSNQETEEYIRSLYNLTQYDDDSAPSIQNLTLLWEVAQEAATNVTKLKGTSKEAYHGKCVHYIRHFIKFGILFKVTDDTRIRRCVSIDEKDVSANMNLLIAVLENNKDVSELVKMLEQAQAWWGLPFIGYRLRNALSHLIFTLLNEDLKWSIRETFRYSPTLMLLLLILDMFNYRGAASNFISTKFSSAGYMMINKVTSIQYETLGDIKDRIGSMSIDLNTLFSGFAHMPWMVGIGIYKALEFREKLPCIALTGIFSLILLFLFNKVFAENSTRTKFRKQGLLFKFFGENDFKALLGDEAISQPLWIRLQVLFVENTQFLSEQRYTFDNFSSWVSHPMTAPKQPTTGDHYPLVKELLKMPAPNKFKIGMLQCIYNFRAKFDEYANKDEYASTDVVIAAFYVLHGVDRCKFYNQESLVELPNSGAREQMRLLRQL